MQAHFEGYYGSVKSVMQASGRGALRGVGPVSELIRTDDRYAVAVETALGSQIQNIVVGTDADAKAAIQYLKSTGAGRRLSCRSQPYAAVSMSRPPSAARRATWAWPPAGSSAIRVTEASSSGCSAGSVSWRTWTMRCAAQSRPDTSTAWLRWTARSSTPAEA